MFIILILVFLVRVLVLSSVMDMVIISKVEVKDLKSGMLMVLYRVFEGGIIESEYFDVKVYFLIVLYLID